MMYGDWYTSCSICKSFLSALIKDLEFRHRKDHFQVSEEAHKESKTPSDGFASFRLLLLQSSDFSELFRRIRCI